MQRSTAKRRVATAAPQAAIVLDPQAGREGRSRSGLALLVFMRVTAALWIAQGALQWAAVLSTGPGGLSPFAALTPAAMAAAVFFAVVNFIAAVGLWLSAPWGGVIWIVAALAQIAVAGAQTAVVGAMPGFFAHPVATGLADVALVAGYFSLVWLAAQAGDAAG